VQVTAGTKISDLVRGIRVKASYLPRETMNPRISIDGEQIGHGMTLGEVGVDKDKKAKVVFSYDSS
jgi:hypothetical protein